MNDKTKIIKICACCKETLIELTPEDDPLVRWICDECYMEELEPNFAAGEGYNQ